MPLLILEQLLLGSSYCCEASVGSEINAGAAAEAATAAFLAGVASDGVPLLLLLEFNCCLRS
jgi:hypothetical protein